MPPQPHFDVEIGNSGPVSSGSASGDDTGLGITLLLLDVQQLRLLCNFPARRRVSTSATVMPCIMLTAFGRARLGNLRR